MINKSVYLAGGITGLTFDEAVKWREDAEKKLAEYGVEVISPLRGKRYLKEIAGENTLKDHYANKAMSTSKAITCRDRHDVKRSGAVLVNFLKCPRVSIGTCLEIAWADAFRVPTVVVMEQSDYKPILEKELRYWLAALIDGEGSINVIKIENNYTNTLHSPYFQLRIIVSMQSKEMIEAAYNASKLGTVNGPDKRKMYDWRISGHQAASVLKEIYPYLIVKKDEAKAAIAMMELAKSQNNTPVKGIKGFQPKTKELLDKQEYIYKQFRLARDRQPVDLPEVQLPIENNIHQHSMIKESVGFVTEDLDEGIDLIGRILGTGN